MPPVTRRHVMAASAAAIAASAAASPAETYPIDLVRRHDQAVDRLLKAQVTDPASPHAGGLADEFGLYHAGSAGGVLESSIAAYLCPQSQHYRNNELVPRMRLAAAFLERVQLPSGNINLLTTNFNSPPDTGFVTHNVASAARLAQLYHHPELVAIPEGWLRRAGGALAVGGVHTPNHRWVICEALAAIDEVFPDPRYRRRIDQWLAEGIDIDSEGQFTERSTSIYNTVVDHALTVVAIKKQRWDLLDSVRRNLDAMQYLLHSNGEVVTEISRRQDLNARGDLGRYWLPLHYLAVHDGNGRYAAMTRLAGSGASLAAAMQYPELSSPLPPSEALPEDFERFLEGPQVVRWRRGPASATLALGPYSRFFTLRKGEAVIQAVRFATAFFGKGQFAADRSAKIAGGYRLEQTLEGVYYQPFDPPRKITTANYDPTRSERPHSEVCRLTQAVEVRERKGGFSLALESTGTDGIPLAVEISFRPGGKLEGCTDVGPDTWLLTGSRASFRMGSDEIRFGPGDVPAPHRWIQLRGAEPRVPGTSVYLTGFTPFRRTLQFDY